MLSNEDEYQNKPFIITVDTEEDNAWIKSDNPSTIDIFYQVKHFQEKDYSQELVVIRYLYSL